MDDLVARDVTRARLSGERSVTTGKSKPRAGGDPRGADLAEALPAIRLSEEAQARYNEMRDSPQQHMRTIKERQFGRAITAPPEKPWGEMTNYEQGWALAFDEQDMQRRLGEAAAFYRWEHPFLAMRAKVGLRMRVVAIRLFAFLLLALVVGAIDLVLILLHSPIVFIPRG